MRAIKLTSSAIERAAYDDDEKTLRLWFKDSGMYVYSEVPAIIFETLKKTESAGRFFAECIKGRFPCRFDPARRKFRPH